MGAQLKDGRLCHLDVFDDGPYRKNTAPPVKKWDGRLSPNQGQAGSPSRLRFAADGEVVNIETGEYVETRPFLIRQPPARRHAMRGSAAVRVTGWRFVLAVLAVVIVGVGMVMLAGKGVGR